MMLYLPILLRSFAHTSFRSSHSAHISSCQLPGKAFFTIRGPDAVKFLNGLLPAKLLPTFVKKNLTTISPDAAPSKGNPEIPDFDMTRGGWGIYKEGTFAAGPFISRFGTYSAILNRKGKLVADLVLYPTPLSSANLTKQKYPEYLLQCDSTMVDMLNGLFDSHRLLQKVKIVLTPNLKLWHAKINMNKYPEWKGSFSWEKEFWEPMTSMKTPSDAQQFSNWFLSQFFPGSQEHILGAYYDTRNIDTAGDYSHFYFVTKNTLNDINSLFNPVMVSSPTTRASSTLEQVTSERLQRGVLEGSVEMPPNTLIPLELNMDMYDDSVSFDKGCYIGQELTARTYATGVVRKRSVPVTLDRPIEHLTKDVNSFTDIYTDHEIQGEQTPASSLSPFGSSQIPRPKKKRPIGKLIYSSECDGVALIKLEYISEARKLGTLPCYIPIEGSGEIIKLKISKENTLSLPY